MPDSTVQDKPSKQKGDQRSLARAVEADSLLQGEKQVVIRHAGEEYRLIVTRNNRLILQK